MKKIILIVSMVLCATMASAQSNSNHSILERINVGASVNKIYSPNFSFSSGFLKNNPSIAMDVTGTVRIGNRICVGGYVSLMGCSPTGTSSSQTYSTAPGTTLYTLGWDNDKYNISGGILVELHSLRFNNRDNDEMNWADFIIRGGFGLNGQTDGIWCGFGYAYRINHYLSLTLFYDYGGFPYSTLNKITENYRSSVGGRLSLGMKLNLR